MRQFLIILMTLPALSLVAQSYAHDLTGIAKVVISLEADVKIYAHEETTFLIPEEENKRRKRSKEAEGLTSLTNRGEDNTNYGVEVKREGNQLMVTGLRDRRAPDLVLRLPKDMNVSVEVLHLSDIYVEGFQSEIEAINDLGDIILKNITGPVVSQNRNGNTIAVFTEINQASPSSLVATGGDIILRLPPTAGVNIRSRTPRGEFLTDFKVALTQRTFQNDNRTIVGTINGGGVSFDLRSINGNIYLRKIK